MCYLMTTGNVFRTDSVQNDVKSDKFCEQGSIAANNHHART